MLFGRPSVIRDDSTIPTVRHRSRRHRHIGFGGGIHFCVGAPLARQEIEVSVAGIANAVPGARTRRRARVPPDVRHSRPDRAPADPPQLSNGRRRRRSPGSTVLGQRSAAAPISSPGSAQARARHAGVHVGQRLEPFGSDLVPAGHAPSVGAILEPGHRPPRRRLHVTGGLEEHAGGITILLQDAGSARTSSYSRSSRCNWATAWSSSLCRRCSRLARFELMGTSRRGRRCVRATTGMERLNATRTA